MYQFLSEMYGAVADVEEVDGIHLDYIRFPDVILARGLWDKYGLVMDREYPEYDYCYCYKCVNDFKELSGIDIKSVEDPSQIQEMQKYIRQEITELQSVTSLNPVNMLVGASGSFEVIEQLLDGKYNSDVRKFSKLKWQKLYNKIIQSTEAQRFAMEKLPNERVQLIVVAFILIEVVLNMINTDTILVSPYALKEGVLAEMMWGCGDAVM